ncbi:MAG: SHOCT domain-containing protein [Actinobacteria bacterium]|nr:SHOCT domain-containing protein [Actinomycetota bacterium]
MLSEAPWGQEWVDAIRRDLSPGESLVAYSQCYTEIWNERWNNSKSRTDYVFSGFDWMHVALTNANLRFVRFQKHKVKTGFLTYKVEMLPEVASREVTPITQVVTIDTRQYQPERMPTKHLSRLFGTAAGPVMRLGVVTPAGRMEVSSPYLEFQALAASLQGAITGGALIRQSGSMADAVAKLADLRREGLLTDEEFERAKSGFVGSSVEVTENSAGLIRQLAQLRDAGVLTDGEFRIKKWDILSRPG